MEQSRIESLSPIRTDRIGAGEANGDISIAGAIAGTIARAIAAAERGDGDACYDLGVAYSTGSHGLSSDLVEAHKWFNLAAARGHEEAAWCRADISSEMTARDIAEAQRRARAHLSSGAREVA